MTNNDLLQYKKGKEEMTIEKIVKPLPVMIVENDPWTMTLISELLKNLGFNVTEAFNGQSALEMLMRCKPAIIFMDTNMPVMDGYEATRNIRQMADPYGSIPVFALIAESAATDYNKCFESGMTDYISKPFRLEEIQKKLKKFLNA